MKPGRRNLSECPRKPGPYRFNLSVRLGPSSPFGNHIHAMDSTRQKPSEVGARMWKSVPYITQSVNRCLF